jgi:hypothetical protein
LPGAHRQSHRSLHASGYRVDIVKPLRARLFAEAIGLRVPGCP